MIPAHPGYAVNFKLEPRPPERSWTHLPVVAWDNDGGPRLDRILTEHPGLVTDARRVFSARRKRNDR